MSNCDVCGKEIVPPADQLHLYVGKVLNRSQQRALGASRTASVYERLDPVQVEVCRRHRWDLVKQRIMPGLITFVLLYVPIITLAGLVFSRETYGPWAQIISATIVTLLIALTTVRLISYESLIAARLNFREAKAGSDREYVTQRKYATLRRGRASSAKSGKTGKLGGQKKKK